MSSFERGVRNLLFMRVPEPKASKDRVHLDLATLADPEGNEFCIGLGPPRTRFA